MTIDEVLDSLALQHYGVKGMKWGRRRSSEVTVKVGHRPTGRTTVKTKGGAKRPAHADAVGAAATKQVLRKSGSHALSNKELQDLTTRLNLEQQVNRLAPSKSKKTVRFLLSKNGQNQVRDIAQAPETKAVAKVLKRKAAIGLATAALAV